MLYILYHARSTSPGEDVSIADAVQFLNPRLLSHEDVWGAAEEILKELAAKGFVQAERTLPGQTRYRISKVGLTFLRSKGVLR